MQAEMQLAARRVTLARERRELEGRLTEIKREAAAIDEQLMEAVADGRFPHKASVDGATVYVRQQFWAGRAEGASKEHVVHALREAGLDEYVTEPGFNTQSLSAYVRDVAKERTGSSDLSLLSPEQIRDMLPEPLRAVVRVTEKNEIRVT